MGIFQIGEVVFDRMRPNQKLVVIAMNGRAYSCAPEENRALKPLTYLERDLKSDGFIVEPLEITPKS